MTLALALGAQEGTVTDAADLRVALDDGTSLACLVLQTTDAPPPMLSSGDRVLVLCPSDGETAYVLGRLTTADDAARDVRITMPGRVDTVRVNGKRIHIQADDELVLECGEGRIRIDQRGKVTVLGRDITSRARHAHKVKGASVAIN